MRLCALSVDLDEIDNYRALHGLAQRSRGARAVYQLGLQRCLAFARAEQLQLTLFTIGRDLERAEAAEAIAVAAQAGHAVESHSYGHRYDLSRLPAADMVADLTRAQRLIEEVTGRAPQGFRAPGYVTSAALLQAVAQVGLRFDASSLPSPPYQLAKAAALLRLRAAGRDSVAIVDSPRAAFAPRTPHPLTLQPRHDGEGVPLWELPMAVTRRLRLPVIGTSLTLAGVRGAQLLARGCLDLPLVSLELHGIDWLDERDGLDDLRPHQPDVRLPLAHKRAAFRAALQVLRAAGYRFVTLAEAYRALERSDGAIVSPSAS